MKRKEMVNQNNIYYVPYDREIFDTLSLVEELKESGWVDSSMVIVNCLPDYSSVPSQIINHKLSFLNRNELYEQISLEIPYPAMSQIWNREGANYELFDRYLVEWVNKHIGDEFKYLFVCSKIVQGNPFNKLKSLIRDKTKDYKFLSLYLQDDAGFTPNYVKALVPAGRKIVFGWENTNNKNF